MEIFWCFRSMVAQWASLIYVGFLPQSINMPLDESLSLNCCYYVNMCPVMDWCAVQALRCLVPCASWDGLQVQCDPLLYKWLRNMDGFLYSDRVAIQCYTHSVAFYKVYMCHYS